MLTHHIILFGLPGAGKSTVGRLLAQVLGMPFIDTDDLIIEIDGRSIPEIFASEGELGFRRLEYKAIRAALGSVPAVISLGGGALTQAGVKELLEGLSCVYLQVSPGKAASRIRNDQNRPLLRSKADLADSIAELAEERTQAFETAASIKVLVDDLSPAQVVQQLLQVFSPSLSLISVETQPPYPVLVGEDLSQIVARRAAELGNDVFLVHPPTLRQEASALREVLASQINGQVLLWEHADAEAGKCVSSAEAAWEILGAHSFGRDSVVIGFGGGATTDLAGFIAATWLRGVPVLMCSTTLLGMVDAAVGGKTGINTAAGKNLVGAFYTPSMVFCDLKYLETLPPEQISSGLAEVLKCGYIRDAKILDLVDQFPRRDASESVLTLSALNPAVLRELITRAITVKAEVVAADFKESGLREILNYGHTFGHAIERVEKYSWLHGNAVAVGMVFAHALAIVRGRLLESELQVLRNRLETLSLPSRYIGNWAELLAAMRNDKKVRGGVIRFVLLGATEDPQTFSVTELRELEAAAILAGVQNA